MRGVPNGRRTFKKISAYLSRGDRYFEERRLDTAYSSYLDALYTIGAYFVYRDTGLLLPINEMMRILEGRHPEIHRVISMYLGMTEFDENTVTSLRNEVEKVRGMMSLPSSEE